MKRIFSLFLALFLCLSLFACGKQPEEVPQEPQPPEAPQEPVIQPETPDDPQVMDPADPLPEEQFTPVAPEISLETVISEYLTETGDATLLQVTTVLPVCPGLPQIDDYYRSMREDLTATYRLNLEDALRQYREFADAGLDFLPRAAEVTTEIVRNDGVTLSVLREIYENLGGAHPLVTYRAETFDVASQGRLVLGNLFTVSEDEYLPRLQDMILVQMDQKEADSGIAYFDDAREQLLTLLDPMDFALTDDHLLIFYNVYALAPHAAGPQQFYLPLSELSDILNPQWVK